MKQFVKKENMKIVISLALSVLYLLLESYITATSLSIAFFDALLYHNLIIKIFVIAAFLILPQIHFHKNTQENSEASEDIELEVFKKVSQVITSPIPIISQVNQISALVKSHLKTPCVFIAEYQTNEILILNTDPNLKEFGIKEKYSPYAENLQENSIEYILSLFFLEKRDFLTQKVETLDGPYQAYFSALTRENSSKPFGIIVILSEKEENFEHIIKGLSALIAFSISLHQKKIASEKFQEQLLQKDDTLGIPTNTVLQTIIEREYHRFLRYESNLSLIIIEIDHIQNLQNIFSAEVILELKKEFSKLITKNIRATDTFGKWTENRFAIVASSIDFRSARSLAKKLTSLLANHRFVKVGKITCSYGVTSLATEDKIATFRKRAEDALNEAIKKGGNAIEVKILV
jgi:diguanylate cyclase (GGDEF)-like protein